MGTRLSKDQVRQLIKDNDLKTAEDVQSVLKDLFKDTLQEMLEAEITDSLGYDKSDKTGKATANRRNGHTGKSVRSEYGEIDLEVPRDRDGEFEPAVVKKRQKSVTGIEDQIVALYAKGVSTREIQDHLKQLYGVFRQAFFPENGVDYSLSGNREIHRLARGHFFFMRACSMR